MSRDYVRKKCAKCNVFAAEDKSLNFHRFPLPGKHGMSRTWAWAKYCYPDEDWSSEASLQNLHFQHKMLCSKHFDRSCYTTGSKKRLNIFAIPSDTKDYLTKYDMSVNKSQLRMKNNTELIKRSNNLKQEAEMDTKETSIEATSVTDADTTLDTRPRVTAEQSSILCNFFEENPEIVRGYKRSPKCLDKIQNKWKNITPRLNAVGPSRDHRSWAKYLCDMKAKLKRKSIKWRQSCDGKDPVMCNIDDFSEIRLRMLQVLRADVSNSQDSQDSHTSDLETTLDNNCHDNNNEGETFEMDTLPEEIADVKPKLELLQENSLHDSSYTASQVETPSDLQPSLAPFEDEFDHFGKNVAEQLRNLPLLVALETQEMLLTVLKKQRLKVLNTSDPLTNK
ncbi:hypothetical protein PYW08_007260 [Mythimna loreyi]|uniref:Uncharacterized protein n=1 Tax=Mythimna loreyi TaxID=667449 RepID=A0ACC2R964_9NEOP|nr:hypothetical protein PYW08_007260 [Mythimna loreyi]